MEDRTLGAAMREAEALVADEPGFVDPATTHWLDQGVSRLVDACSLAFLVETWFEPKEVAYEIPVAEMDDEAREWIHVFRLANARAILAKARPLELPAA